MGGRIFITGDIHGKPERFSKERFPRQRELDKDDYMIICGDFGLVWDGEIVVKGTDITVKNEESKRETWWLDWLETLPFTVLFVDGNHENFDRLGQYPVEEWMGGKVHKIRPSVIHLMRGQVFTIAGKRIFTFGGARSHDIEDGILECTDPDLKEKKREMNRQGALYRVNHESWWEEEMPSEEEMQEGLKNLAQYGNEVDYIISHCCPGTLQQTICFDMEVTNEQTAYFDELKRICQYKKWYFGHFHDNKNVTEKDILLYEDILEAGEDVNENHPVIGKPRYKMYQPVKFFCMENGEQVEKVGLVYVRDAYGTLSNPDEPSYDIMALLGESACLFKHHAESAVTALTEEEIEVYKNLLVQLVGGMIRGDYNERKEEELSMENKEQKVMLHYWHIRKKKYEGEEFIYAHGIVSGHERLSDTEEINTSEIKNIEIDDTAKEALIYTRNTIYHCPLEYLDFEHQEEYQELLPEYVHLKETYRGKREYPSIETGKVLLVLSNFDPYYFNSLYYKATEDDSPSVVRAFPHVGMFQDSFLVSAEGLKIDLRYFPHYENIEFYTEKTDGKPWFLENIGTGTLYARTSCGIIRLGPGERKEVKAENAEKKEPLLLGGDLYPPMFLI